MKHMARTHRIDFPFLHEVVSGKQVVMRNCRTVDLCSFVFTKHVRTQQVWDHVVGNIAHMSPDAMWGIADMGRLAQPDPDDCTVRFGKQEDGPKAVTGQLAQPTSSARVRR